MRLKALEGPGVSSKSPSRVRDRGVALGLRGSKENDDKGVKDMIFTKRENKII